jgi:nucleoside-diphosphate-sugar epimerase
MESLFVTGGTGFIGRAVLRHATKGEGRRVMALTRSAKSADQLIACGVEAVEGDLTQPGQWQDSVAQADLVLHLAQPPTFGRRLSRRRFKEYAANLVRMDDLLFDSLSAGTVKRIVYVGGSTYWGDQGRELKDESAEPNPAGGGSYIAAAIDGLAKRVEQGFPIVEAYPGGVYGPGSWFEEYVLMRLVRGKPIYFAAGYDNYFPYVHVDDCARAMLHLLEVGEPGQRYFIVDDCPRPSREISEIAAEALGVDRKTRNVPRLACRAILGPISTEWVTLDQCLSNARLRGLGFDFEFPRAEEGIPDVVAQWKADGPHP